MECFVIDWFQPLTVITKHSILDVAAALDPPVIDHFEEEQFSRSINNLHVDIHRIL